MDRLRNVVTLLVLAALLIACGSPEGDGSTNTSEDGTSGSSSPSEGADVCQQLDSELVVLTWGGVFTEAEQAAFYAPFTEETGAEVATVTPVAFAKYKAAVETGNYDFDVAFLGGSDYYRGIAEDLFEPIDPDVVAPDSTPSDLVGTHGVKTNSVGYQLVYNTDVYGDDGPQSWADFWDVEAFPGERSLYNAPYFAIEAALLADGVPLDELYPLTDEKVDRAFDKLDEIKPHIRVWWEQGAQSQQLMADGEIDMMMMWNGRASDLIADGIPLRQVWHEAGYYMGWLATPKGNPNAVAAMCYMRVATKPENQAEFARLINYGPSHPEAFDHLTEEEASLQPTAPEHAELTFEQDSEWWGTNLSDLQPRWEKWLLG